MSNVKDINDTFNDMMKSFDQPPQFDEGGGDEGPPPKPVFDRNPGGWAIPGWGLFCGGVVIGNIITALFLFTAASVVWFMATMTAIAGFAAWAAWKRWR